MNQTHLQNKAKRDRKRRVEHERAPGFVAFFLPICLYVPLLAFHRHLYSSRCADLHGSDVGGGTKTKMVNPALFFSVMNFDP